LNLDIFEDEPQKLYITIIPRKENHRDSGFVITDEVQVVEVALPDGYGQPIKGSIVKFSKMWKELNSVSKTVRIKGNESKIVFQAIIEDVLGKETEYQRTAGEYMDHEILFDEIYSINDLAKLSKLSSFGSSVYIYARESRPLKIKTTIGDLGELSIFITKRVEEPATIEG
jgi:hypothetical protein